jgi:hypothetical protein
MDDLLVHMSLARLSTTTENTGRIVFRWCLVIVYRVINLIRAILNKATGHDSTFTSYVNRRLCVVSRVATFVAEQCYLFVCSLVHVLHSFGLSSLFRARSAVDKKKYLLFDCHIIKSNEWEQVKHLRV